MPRTCGVKICAALLDTVHNRVDLGSRDESKRIEMRLLVGGCSFSSGWGFTSATIDQNWPNLLSKKLDADLVNVSETGYDNPGIFLNILEQLTRTDFDLCLFQVTALNRIIISPNVHGHRLFPFPQANISNGRLSDGEYAFMTKKFVIVNQDIEHWNRLFKIITTVQNLNKQGKNIKFVNGLLHWDRNFFSDPEKSNFIKTTIDSDNLPDEDIVKFTQVLYNQAQTIDLTTWVNPFGSLKKLSVDFISPGDLHPGLESHRIFADTIYKGITQ